MSLQKIRQILNEAGPDSIPGRLEPKGPVQDLGGPVVTPATVKGADYDKPIAPKQAALPKQGGAASEGGAPNPTKYKDEADVKAKLRKELGEEEEGISELPEWLQDRLAEMAEEELDEEEIDEAEDDDEDDKEDVDESELPEDEEVSEDELEEDEEVSEPVNENTFKISKPNLTNEDVNALFAGTKLTEKAKNQILTVFEAVCAREINAQMALIGERYNQELAEEVDAMAEVLGEQVDRYLDSITESWVEQNELALENGIRTQLAESLLEEMKNVFTRHYVDIPENKIDMVDTLAEKVEELEDALNESLMRNAKLTEQVVNASKNEIIRSATRGMVDLTAEKIAKLAEGVEFVSAEDFAQKVETIKEHYGSTKKPGSVTLTEETGDNFNSDNETYENRIAKAVAGVFKN